jgi:hypothetical protein
MLVTFDDTVFFRNRYTGYELDTIQNIGACRTSELLDIAPQKTSIPESDLVRLVEQWLEEVRVARHRSWPPGAAEAIESYVVPAVTEGIVRATGPRLRRTGT